MSSYNGTPHEIIKNLIRRIRVPIIGRTGYHERLFLLASRVMDRFRRGGLRFVAGDGTLLGVVRYKGFIPWDDGVDLVILGDETDRALELLDDLRSMYDVHHTSYLRIKERQWRGPYLDIQLVWPPADGSYDLAPDTLLKNQIVELPFYDTTIPCPIEYQKTLFDRWGGECLKKDAWGRSVTAIQRKRLNANRLRREGLATLHL